MNNLASLLLSVVAAAICGWATPIGVGLPVMIIRLDRPN